MPDEINVMDPAAVAAANEATRAALESQGREGLKADTFDNQSTIDSLDTLAKKAEADAGKEADEPVVEPKDLPAADPAVTKAKADEGKSAETPPVKPDEATTKLADEMFKGVSLPQGASPKSTEAFSTVKVRAAQEIASREAKLVEAQKQIEELNARLKNPIPPELEKELKEHREWRAKLDVEADPKFNEHTRSIEASREFIYAQLKKGGLSDDLIKKVKEYGGPENVNLTTIFQKGGPGGQPMDTTTQRLVESKVADIEQAKFNRDQAIKSAKENIGAYLKSQEEARTKDITGHDDATKAELETLYPQVQWLQPVKVEGDEAARKGAEEHNAFLKKTSEEMNLALKDGSAQMRATLILGMGRLFVTQRELKAANDKLQAAEASLKEANTKLEKYMNASRSKLPQSGASATGNPTAKPKTDFSQSASESLDAIAKQVSEERARAANSPSV